MKKISLTTPENIEVEYKLADLGSRTGAVIIDSLIQGIFFLLLAGAVILINVLEPDFWDAYYGWILGITYLLFIIISYGYYIFMELKMNGMTPGKKILKLRTIRQNGQALTLKHSAIRNLFRIFIDMAGVGPLFIFFSKEHKRIGDFAAATIVVIEEEKSRPAILEIGQERAERLKNHLTQEEYELLADYFKRKSNFKDLSLLKTELKSYFKDKYQETEIKAELRKIIEEI